MAKTSAGLLMYRRRGTQIEFLLVHPGGPFWKNKDAGAWTIPKGEVEPGEDAVVTAKREFQEELGLAAQGTFTELHPVKQKSGKIVQAWAFEGDCDPRQIVSNTFTIEWPPRSGNMAAFPEVDRVEFFALTEARQKINPAQISFLDEIVRLLSAP
jgi:predicted NUDIX family NTP pyrophosphohydrolase